MFGGDLTIIEFVMVASAALRIPEGAVFTALFD